MKQPHPSFSQPEGKKTPPLQSQRQSMRVEEPVQELLTAFRYRQSLEKWMSELEKT